jgi:hypothetical protein
VLGKLDIHIYNTETISLYLTVYKNKLKYCIHMFVSGKMRPVETYSRNGGRGGAGKGE